MLMPRDPRVVALGVLLAVLALAGCRTSPDVAAYVGDAQVTVTELEEAVDERLTDENVAAFASTPGADYARRVLGFLVEREVYAAVAERYDVSVGDAAVRARIDELGGPADPDDVYAELALRGAARTDVVETIRQQLIREEVAEADGAGGLSESALRTLYGEIREDYAQLEFGYVTVPDQATATAVLAQLTAAPTGYPAVAAEYPGEATLPELLQRAPADLPAVFREEFTAAQPNTGFTKAVKDLGVVVGFVTGVVYPSFEQLRAQVQAVAAERVDAAGAEAVERVRADLDVTVNPHYGVLDEDGRLVRNDGGVVEILSRAESATGVAGATGDGPGD